MALISKDVVLHDLAAGYIEVTGDSYVTYGNFAEKNKAALGSGGGYGNFEVKAVIPQELHADTSATEFTDRPES